MFLSVYITKHLKAKFIKNRRFINSMFLRGDGSSSRHCTQSGAAHEHHKGYKPESDMLKGTQTDTDPLSFVTTPLSRLPYTVFIYLIYINALI